MKKKRLVVLSGAGLSAESGLSTFRDSNGLWEQHRIEDVATPEAWTRQPDLVLRFYNQRRSQLASVTPNRAHQQISQLEAQMDVQIITQNVDDLHERAGSSRVLHLHGQLTQARSTGPSQKISNISYEKIELGDCCEDGFQLRPHIVWFGEAVPAIETAQALMSKADALVIVGTSLQVYPAAGLIYAVPSHAPIYLIDPAPAATQLESHRLTVIKEKATIGMSIVAQSLLRD